MAAVRIPRTARAARVAARAARAAKEDVRAVVAKAAPLLREIWVVRVESRQPVLDRCPRQV